MSSVERRENNPVGGPLITVPSSAQCHRVVRDYAGTRRCDLRQAGKFSSGAILAQEPQQPLFLDVGHQFFLLHERRNVGPLRFVILCQITRRRPDCIHSLPIVRFLAANRLRRRNSAEAAAMHRPWSLQCRQRIQPHLSCLVSSDFVRPSAASPTAARAPRAAKPLRRRAWLRIFVVRCALPCDPPVGGHSCNAKSPC